MFANQLAEIMKANRSSYELFEVWDGDSTAYGFLDSEGLHFFSTESERTSCLSRIK